MSQSRTLGLLGASAAIFLAAVGAGVRLATTEYVLHIRILDANGPVSGAWVALADRDVVTSAENGFVTFKGSRFELDSGLLTVSDPSASSSRLSQTVRTQVNWNPLQSESTIDVFLPIVAAAPSQGIISDHSDSALDIPIDVNHADHLRPSALSEGKITEEQLGDPHSASLMNSDLNFQILSITERNIGGLICLLSGLSEKLCANDENSFKPPLFRESSPGTVADQAMPKLLSEIDLKENHTPDSLQSKEVNFFSENTASEKIFSHFIRPIRVEVLSDGKPLAGALVYMSRLKDARVRELGSTSTDGLLLVKVSPRFWGETVTVFHDCCAPKTTAAKLTQHKGEDRLKIEMQSGTGMGVLVQHEAYGFLRKLESFDLAGVNGKLSVAGQDGFALYNSTKTPEQVANRILVRQAKPAEIFIRPNDIKESQSRPLSFVVAPDEVYLPAIAVIEKQDGRPFQGVLKNSMLRRWRRDFMARLMQQTSLRSVVSVEAEARISAAGESATDIVANGWNQTPLAGEWDFLLAIDYDEGRQSVNLIATSSDGRAFYDQNLKFEKSSEVVPESLSRQLFQSFLGAVPFESYVVGQQGQSIELSFSSIGLFGLKENSPLALYQQNYVDGEHKSQDLAALAVVVPSDSARGVRARITHWNSRVRKTEVLPELVKAVKITNEIYNREAVKLSSSQNKTKSSGKTL